MKSIAKLIVLSVFLLPLVLVGGFTLVVEDEPKLHGRADLTPERIAHGKRVLEQNDPRRIKSGSIAKAQLRTGRFGFGDKLSRQSICRRCREIGH